MTTLIYWFRDDLRLSDNRALLAACGKATRLLPVYCHDPGLEQATRWGFVRRDAHRRRFLDATLADLRHALQARGSDLLELQGRPQDVLPLLAAQAGVTAIHCESIAAPEEQSALRALRQAGLAVNDTWQSSLLEPARLPFGMDDLPDVFTAFRQRVERAGLEPEPPLPAPASLPALPVFSAASLPLHQRASPDGDRRADDDDRSSFPYRSPRFAGGETAALAHLRQYFSGTLPQQYKQTRNGLQGTDYSTKFSPWLATGALSARSIHAALRSHEAVHGANDSTYWIFFELLWRDYFRFLQLKYGSRLYRAGGLRDAGEPPHDARRFVRWCEGRTGEPLIDAGMRELRATGYLSNRLRQVVASHLVHDLGCDWRAGAAWFESQLLDYDACSNQGNWLYVSGRGTDPRVGRRFNVQKQGETYDPDGHYRRLWRQ